MDIEFVDDVLGAVARVELMPRFGRLAASEVFSKSSAFDVVSVADRAAEQAITRAVLARYPEAVVIGEEAADAEPAILRQLDTAELALVVDPLDGTKNFVSGLPLFAVMAAVLRAGRVVAGVIHDPVTDTSAVAVEGGGAWLRRGGVTERRLRVAAPAPVAEMEAVAGTQFVAEPLRGVLAANLGRLGSHTWLRCAGHEYRMAAAGHCHLLTYHRLMPWDHAPGWLLHREAGGFSAQFDGTAYSPTVTSGGLICTSDEASWQALRAALLEAD
jgi:fructose-1,6-bisphosphatase/inositol monophosphatase family enzyme